ncbi:MAG: RdgB/HAM1 family non-canonical purine NTP pyrophosphatase [Mucilaginibacter polytrichastri]|nr:RdgB/HAM1 family non-canonical purine NTP pyrophosphatase [Mucilaginibacter polytrichastri]
MRKLVFATHNRHKTDEVAAMLKGRFEVVNLTDIGFHDEIDETGETFEENASLKSRAVYARFGLDCFADDSGLEIDALGGRPGVYSARFAGAHGDHEANIRKVLSELGNKDQRAARFRTVISLLLNGEETYFEGIAEGSIRREKSGSEGFGYDPIFEPEGYSITFAEMPMEEKNRISHRAKAIEKMVAALDA